MNLGTYPITELFLGGSPIKSIWLGTTQVWTYTYDYEVSDIKLVYSDGGTYLKCDASNYAYISYKLTKKKGTYIESTETKKLDFDFSSDLIGNYFDKGEDGTIRFSLSKYGTEDLSIHSNPFTVGLSPHFGDTYYSPVYMYAEPNVQTYSTSIGYDIHTSDYSFINATNTSFSTYCYCFDVHRTYYKSGMTGKTNTAKTWYVYDASITTGPYIASGNSGQRLSISCGSNPNNYPLVRSYRIGYIGVTQEDVDTDQTPPSSVSPYDCYIDILHKSRKTYSATTTQALFYGVSAMGEDYTIQSSTDIIVANDAHTNETVYDFSCSDSGIKITQKNGLIYINGVTSSTDCWFEVTTYIPKEKDEWWQDEPVQEKTIISYNILGS